MTILGWVTIGVGYALAMYLWYMCVCFWKMLRVASADRRRVTRALATLPTLKFKGKTATARAVRSASSSSCRAGRQGSRRVATLLARAMS